MFGFSSRPLAEDGVFNPNLSAPGAAVSTVPLWQQGSPVLEAGYGLPLGYAMSNGTSMSPQAPGGAALRCGRAGSRRPGDAGTAPDRVGQLGAAHP